MRLKNYKKCMLLFVAVLLVAGLLAVLFDVYNECSEIGHYSIVVINETDSDVIVSDLKSGELSIGFKQINWIGDWRVNEQGYAVNSTQGEGLSIEFDGLGDFTLVFQTGNDCGQVSITESNGKNAVLDLNGTEGATIDYEFVNGKTFHKKALVVEQLVCLVVAVVIVFSSLLLFKSNKTRSYIQLVIMILCSLLWIGASVMWSETSGWDYSLINPTVKSVIGLGLLWMIGIFAEEISLHISEKKSDRLSIVIRVSVSVVWPCICFAYVEKFRGYNGWHAGVRILIANAIFYYLIYLVIIAIARKTRVAMIATIIISAMMAYTDYFVWLLRTRNFMASDLRVLKTALDVSSEYTFTLNTTAYIFLMYLLVIIVGSAILPSEESWSIKKIVAIFIPVCIFCAIMVTSFLTGDYASRFNYNISWWSENIFCEYKDKGFALGFITYGQNMLLKKPDGYNKKEVETTLQNIQELIDQNEEAGLYDAEVVNLIVIMNEAWSDIVYDSDTAINNDYMPFYHSLTDNTVKGQLYVSVTGGNTVDTEYEFLTGNSMAFFPSGSVPYMQYVTGDVESIERYLDNRDYNQITFHPFHDFCYDRDSVYKKMGFRNSYWINDVAAPECYGSWFSERKDFEIVEEYYEDNALLNKQSEESKSFFAFNVTIQNHGAYTKDLAEGLIDTDFEFTELEDLVSDTYDITEYVTKLYETDQALEELIEYYSNQDEKTVVVMFGDHQPKLSEEVYDAILPQDGLLESLQTRYVVPFFVWANYDIDEAQDVKMSANFLSSYVVDLIGIKPSAYMYYINDVYQQINAINAFGYLGADGNWYERGSGPTEYESIMDTYEYLQYYNVKDKNKKVDYFR